MTPPLKQNASLNAKHRALRSVAAAAVAAVAAAAASRLATSGVDCLCGESSPCCCCYRCCCCCGCGRRHRSHRRCRPPPHRRAFRRHFIHAARHRARALRAAAAVVDVGVSASNFLRERVDERRSLFDCCRRIRNCAANTKRGRKKENARASTLRLVNLLARLHTQTRRLLSKATARGTKPTTSTLATTTTTTMTTCTRSFSVADGARALILLAALLVCRRRLASPLLLSGALQRAYKQNKTKNAQRSSRLTECKRTQLNKRALRLAFQLKTNQKRAQNRIEATKIVDD